MFIIGFSNYILGDKNVTVTFPTTFVSGLGGDDKPIVIVSPECRRDGWNNTVSHSTEQNNVELDMRVWYSDKSKFIASSRRGGGTNNDYARANYIAIGKY